jgi:hypothetical protein
VFRIGVETQIGAAFGGHPEVSGANREEVGSQTLPYAWFTPHGKCVDLIAAIFIHRGDGVGSGACPWRGSPLRRSCRIANKRTRASRKKKTPPWW